MPSPLPAKPSRSVVVPRTLTREASTPRAPARFSRIACLWSRILGLSQTTTASTLATSHDVADEAAHLAQQLYGIGVPVPLVGVGEVVADVLEAGGPEQGVGYGVGQNVGVGVSEQAALEGDLDAAEHEPAAFLRRGESVDVNAEADAHQDRAPLRASSRAASMASANTRSSGEVSLMLVFSPSTTTTRPPSRSTREASSVAESR